MGLWDRETLGEPVAEKVGNIKAEVGKRKSGNVRRHRDQGCLPAVAGGSGLKPWPFIRVILKSCKS